MLYFRSLDNEGDLMNFLYNLFFLLIDFKSPGVIQGELQLFSSLPLMTFKGKQALVLGSSSRNEAQFVFETFLLTLRKFLSVILRMNTLFSPSRVRVLPEK